MSPFCTSVAGVGTDMSCAPFDGLVGEWTSSLSLSYKEPSVSEVSGPGAFGSRTEGGATVNIYGRNFGPRFTNNKLPWYHSNANLYPTRICC